MLISSNGKLIHIQKLFYKNGNAYHYMEIKIFNEMEIISMHFQMER